MIHLHKSSARSRAPSVMSVHMPASPTHLLVSIFSYGDRLQDLAAAFADTRQEVAWRSGRVRVVEPARAATRAPR